MAGLNWNELIEEAGAASNNSSLEPLPKGDYELKVLDAEARTSQTGKTMYKITTEVQGGPHAGRRVWDNLVISPGNEKALGMFFMKMGVLGLNREFFGSNPTDAQIETALKGRTFRATVGQRTYQGDLLNEISQYHKGSSAPAPSETVAAAAPTTAAAPAPAPAVAPAPAPAPASPVSSDDESPF